MDVKSGTPAPKTMRQNDAVIDYVCDIGAHFLEIADKADKRAHGRHEPEPSPGKSAVSMLEGTDEVPGLRHIDNVEVSVDMEDLTYEHSDCR